VFPLILLIDVGADICSRAISPKRKMFEKCARITQKYNQLRELFVDREARI
jgi:hypothetical protein